MRTLICFDVDGIFEQREEESQYVKGPLDPFELRDHFCDHDSVCMIVSPSPYFPKDINGEPLFEKHAEWESNTMRWKNLIDCQKACIVPPDIKIYVSDNGDFKEAKKAGFIYCDINDFDEMMYTQFHIPDTPTYKRKDKEDIDLEEADVVFNSTKEEADEIKKDLEDK